MVDRAAASRAPVGLGRTSRRAGVAARAAHRHASALDEWADAVAAQLAARELEVDDAIDALHTASYLGDGVTAAPCVHAARALFDAGRAPAALAVVLRATGPVRAQQPARAVDARRRRGPVRFRQGADGRDRRAGRGRARSRREARALGGRVEPGNADAQRALGFALAQQGKLVDALSPVDARDARARAASPREHARAARQARRRARDPGLREPVVHARRRVARPTRAPRPTPAMPVRAARAHARAAELVPSLAAGRGHRSSTARSDLRAARRRRSRRCGSATRRSELANPPHGVARRAISLAGREPSRGHAASMGGGTRGARRDDRHDGSRGPARPLPRAADPRASLLRARSRAAARRADDERPRFATSFAHEGSWSSAATTRGCRHSSIAS